MRQSLKNNQLKYQQGFYKFNNKTLPYNCNTAILLRRELRTATYLVKNRRKPDCPFDKKCLSECLGYNASVDRLDTYETKNYYGTCEKNLRNVIATTQHLLGIKTKEKALNSQNTSQGVKE